MPRATPSFAFGLPVFGPAALALALALLGMAQAVRAQVPPRAADTTLTGIITRDDFQTYKRVPFTVPDHVDRIVVAFDHDGRDQHSVIDLGVDDMHGPRGASGGNKAEITIGTVDATPSYLPGPIDAGTWALSLAIPNIRPGVTTHWSARVWFLKGSEAENLPAPVMGRGPGWYRGDLHMHSAHSDGSCTSQAGRTVPCPLFRTLERAAANHLDFVAITEHNAASQAQVLREAQPYFDRLLLIPGREITTFHGHFNVFGVTAPLDYRIAPGNAGRFSDIADRVHALGGLVSINHPALPSGEICMGCGWTMPDADYRKADAVEIVNGSAVAEAGGNAESVISGVPFWLARLREGHALSALGGSDNHNPDRKGPGGVGGPVTVVFARDLAQGAILDGLRSGRAFVALDGTIAPLHLDFSVHAGKQAAPMGGMIAAGRKAAPAITLDVAGPADASLEILDAERMFERIPGGGDGWRSTRPLRLAAGPHLIRIQMRGGDGRLIAIGNAVRVRVE